MIMTEIEYGYEVCRLFVIALRENKKPPDGAVWGFNARRIIIDFIGVTPGDLI